MNKKVMLGIGAITIFVLILVMVNNKKNKNNNEKNVSQEVKVSNIVQDEETGEYYIYNQETGEEIARSEDRIALHIYEIDPNYNPNPIY